MTVRNWRRGHAWWLALAFAAALGSAFALPAAAACCWPSWGTGLWLRARRTGRVEEAREVLLWTAADALGRGAGDPLGAKATRLWTTGTEAGDAAPGGGGGADRAGSGVPRPVRGVPAQTSSSVSMRRSWWRAMARLARPASSTR
ncbi:hypothetical protein ACFQVA_26440 [Actinomadura keratinilytica]